MIMEHLQQPLRVKLIDFGLDCEVSEAQRASHISDRWCRLVTILMEIFNRIFIAYVLDRQTDLVIKRMR